MLGVAALCLASARGAAGQDAASPPPVSPQPVAPYHTTMVGTLDTTVRAASSTLSALVGLVVDSLHGGALSGAVIQVAGTERSAVSDSAGRYRIDSVPPGTHPLALFHPLLDTLGLSIATNAVAFEAGHVGRAILAVPSAATVWRLFCGADTIAPAKTPSGTIVVRHSAPAAILGRVMDPDAEVSVGGAEVTLAWTELEVGKETGLHRVRVTRTATTDVSGTFHLCAVPGPVQGTMHATLGAATTGEVPVAIGGGELLLKELRLAAADTARHSGRETATVAAGGSAGGSAATMLRTGPAVVTGRVVTVGGTAIGGAVVTVLGAAPQVVTADSGAFTLGRLPAGTQTLVVRAIGYTPAEVPVELTSRAPQTVTVTLMPAPPMLPPVHVEAARMLAYQKIGFTERQRMGFGHFLSDSDVARRAAAAVRVVDLFTGMPGVRVEYVSGQPVLRGTRGGSGLTPGGGCVAYVVDGAPVLGTLSSGSMSAGAMSGGRTSGGRSSQRTGGQSGSSDVDIEQYVQLTDIAAVEVYQPSEVPGEFGVSGQMGCVTVVIWTKGKLGLP
jgi:hypothetical protein